MLSTSFQRELSKIQQNMLKTFVASHVFTMCLLESLFEIYDIYVHLPDHMRPHVAMICHDMP